MPSCVTKIPVIKTDGYCHKIRKIDKRNWIKNSDDVNPYVGGQLLLYNKARNLKLMKEILFSQLLLSKSVFRRMQIDSYWYPFTILKTKLIKTLIWNQISWVKSRECRGGLTTHWHRRQHPEENTKAQRVRSIINKFDFMILRKFCETKTTHYQEYKPWSTGWKNVFTNSRCNRSLIFKIHT